jgi:molybdopterin-guanine dinucleotide biosynthesis protein A
MPVVPEGFAAQYRKLVQEHIEAIRTKCSDARIDYVLMNTSQPLDEALFTYLGNRERLMRVR